jgi:hypothetical protein
MTFNVETLLAGTAIGALLFGGAFAILVGCHYLENARRDATAVPAWWIARERLRAGAWLAGGVAGLIAFVAVMWINL